MDFKNQMGLSGLEPENTGFKVLRLSRFGDSPKIYLVANPIPAKHP